MRLKKYGLIFIILLFGGMLRTYRLSATPLYGDELTLAYDTYSILKTGKDQTGLTLPLTFPMRVGSPPGYVYFSVPFVLLFGPTAIGIRMLSVLSGTGSILLIYLISKKLFTEKHGYASAFLMAISPWGINLSRGGFETNFALFLMLLGTVFFLYSVKKPWYIVLGAISFGLAIFSYQTYKLLTPLFFLLMIWYLGGRKYFLSSALKRYSIIAALILGIFILVLLTQVFLNNSEMRFSQTQNELSRVIVQKVDFDRSVSSNNVISSVFHNKYVENFVLLKNTYFGYLSPEFLFLSGDGNPRHNMTQSGVMYLAEAILIILFLVLTVRSKLTREVKFLTGWILISPIAGTTLGDIHGLRSSLMLPGILIISSVGLVYLIEHRNNFKIYLTLLIFTIILVIQFVFLIEKIYFVSPNKFARFWSADAYDAVKITQERYNSYDQIILTKAIDNVEVAYPVYSRLDPNQVIAQKDNKIKQYGKVQIADINEMALASGKTLIIARYEDSKVLGESKEVIKSANFEPALAIYSIEK